MTFDIAKLRGEHAELARIAGEMKTIITPDEPQVAAMHALRWQLCRELLAHLAVEDQFLYPELLASSNTEASSTARQFICEMGSLTQIFKHYMEEWTSERIADDWRGFCEQTSFILSALGARIRKENRVLYPLLNALPLARQAPSTGRPRLSSRG